MPEATLQLVARRAGVAPVTVSRVVNGSENVAPATKEKILAVIRDLDYRPNIHAANLRRKRLDGDNSCRSKSRLECSCERPSAECKVLARQIDRLHRDLDRLKKQSERIQACVNLMQQAYSRRLY